ncbi:hypothetical protein GGR53DRAFT_33369 [Hypoxylon sp. FL1150]|nr:hypothetical protein GGR53DRAFT_33369 [Hypoxylon sp. FL1150]
MATSSEASRNETCITSLHKKSPLVWDQDRKHDKSHNGTHIVTIRAARERGCETCSLLCEALARYKGLPISQLTGTVEIHSFNIFWTIPEPGLQDMELEEVRDEAGVFERAGAEVYSWGLKVEWIRLELFTTTG